MHVVGVGLGADEDDLLPRPAALRGHVGVKDHGALRRPRAGGEPPPQHGLGRGGIDLPVEDLLELVGVHAQQGLVLADHALVRHVHGDFHRGLCGALAGARLQHVELAPLDGELDVLHVPVVALQQIGDALQFLVGLGLFLGQFGDRPRCAGAGDDVLALGVQQVLAVEDLFPGGRVAGEGHARPRRGPHVAEDHRLDVHRGAQVVRDLVVGAVADRPRRIPGFEDGADGHFQLFHRVVRKVRAGRFRNDVAVVLDQFLQILRG